MEEQVWRKQVEVELMLSVFTSDVLVCHTHMVERRGHRVTSTEAKSNSLSNAKKPHIIWSCESKVLVILVEGIQAVKTSRISEELSNNSQS